VFNRVRADVIRSTPAGHEKSAETHGVWWDRPSLGVPDQAPCAEQAQAEPSLQPLAAARPPVPPLCSVIAGRCGCCGGCVAEQRQKSPAKSRLLRCCGCAGGEAIDERVAQRLGGACDRSRRCATRFPATALRWLRLCLAV